MKHNELENNNLSKKMIKNGGLLFIFSLLIVPTGYFINLITSNSLSVADFGLFSAIISFAVFLASYNDLGTTQALNYFLPKNYLKKQYDNVKLYLYVAFFIQFISSLILFYLLYFFADFLAINYFHNIQAASVLKIFSFFFIFHNIILSIEAILNSFQNIFILKLVDFIKQ